MKIVTLKEARSQGLVRYYTGKPCANGHVAERRVKGRSCVECSKLRVRRHEARRVKENPRYNQERHLKRTFDMSLEEYDIMLASQGNSCPTCQSSFEDVTPHVDHCHTTGEVRGILCGPCNQALGLTYDNPETLRRLIDYLKG